MTSLTKKKLRKKAWYYILNAIFWRGKRDVRDSVDECIYVTVTSVNVNFLRYLRQQLYELGLNRS